MNVPHDAEGGSGGPPNKETESPMNVFHEDGRGSGSPLRKDSIPEEDEYVAPELDREATAVEAVRTGRKRAPSFFPAMMVGTPKVDDVASDGRVRVYSFSAAAPENAPVVLVWKDLTVKTRTNPPKTLLHGISGAITGGFWAIMGASGGGKTTLLSTISLRLDQSKIEITGDIHLNGHKYDTGILKSMSAYVLQDDLLHAELTVKETIAYHAELRLAGKMDNAGRLQVGGPGGGHARRAYSQLHRRCSCPTPLCSARST